MPELHLTGCASRPLAGYLKALGVLRVVTEQTDPDVRGRWHRGVFELATAMDRDELEAFFRDRYAPTPVVSPWNGGSGFHPNDRQDAILAIESSSSPRLEPYRRAIAAARECLSHCGISEKPTTAEQKEALVRRLRQTAPDEALDWLDAAIVVRQRKLSYTPLLGSGGNDGRYDFSNNYAQCAQECLLAPGGDGSSSDLEAALWDEPAELQRKLSLGHFLRDSSPNNSPYGEADSLGNPWDLILAVEGALLLTAGAVRRHGAALPGGLAAPFTVRPTSAGYGSAVGGESGRAELWLPIWNGWARLGEIVTLARESRAQVGRGRRQATSGLDFARASGGLGVARGISAFERYAILERAGKSSLAVPVGRVRVELRPGVEALSGIERWLNSVLRFRGSEACPAGPRNAIRQLEGAAFEMASQGGSSEACAVLETIGAVEAALARSAGAAESVRPLPAPPAGPWIAAADDGSDEFLVAASLASLHDAGRHRLPALRDYLHGTAIGENGRQFDPDRRHAVAGGRPVDVLAAIHARRHLDAAGRSVEGGSGRQAPDGTTPMNLGFAFGLRTTLESARRFAAGLLDDRRILKLLLGLALLDYSGEVKLAKRRSAAALPQPRYELLALAWSPAAGRDPRAERGGELSLLGARPGWAARLNAGAADPVLEEAMLRLRMAGLAPLLRPKDMLAGPGDRISEGRRLGAALLLRLGRRDLRKLVQAHLAQKEDKTTTKGETP